MNNPNDLLNWRRFNKQIPDDNYYFLRSCIRQNFFPGAEKIFLEILQNDLNKSILDDAKHTTCAGIGYHSDVVPFDTVQTIAARHFSLMTENGIKHAAVSCITSFGIYSEILETWKQFPEQLKKTRDYLKKSTGREFELPDHIVHTSDILYKFKNEIAQKSKYQLVNINNGQPLKIADHIGCHYAKMFPDKGVGGAEFPKVLSGLISSWGGSTVDYPERRHCCGFGFRHYLVKNNRSYSLSNSLKKFKSLAPYHSDAIIANCPGCAMFLDRWQYTIAQLDGTTFDEEGNGIPVLTHEEFAGIVLGYDPWEIGLQMHQVNVEPLLFKMGVTFDPDKKYKGLNGKIIGKPVLFGCKVT